MAKRKTIARVLKDLDNGAQVITGHRLDYFGRMLWDLWGKERVRRFLQGPGVVGSNPSVEVEDWRYQALQIKPDASTMVLKLAFKKRAWETHPDAGGDEEEFKLVNKAYEEIKQERGLK